MKTIHEEQKSPSLRSLKRPEDEAPVESQAEPPISQLQRQVGNLAVQRMLAQRSGDGPFDLDEETTTRINRERSSGAPLDSSVQRQMGDSLGTDLSGVKVHTSPEANQLNHELGAKAFTTGSDIFFKEDQYQPGTSSGQELLAHELTHVAQQNSGQAGGGNGTMQVNAPGDRFEQEADAVAKAVSGQGNVQRQADHEEDEIENR